MNMKSTKLVKGSLQTIILKLLKENKRMYGYEICKYVSTLSDGDIAITEGALYPALHKLETDGLLSVEIEKIQNRNRKYYSLTKLGGVEVVSRIEALEQFLSSLNKVLNPKLI